MRGVGLDYAKAWTEYIFLSGGKNWAKIQKGWIVRPVSLGSKTNEQSHITRGGKRKVSYMCGHFSS